MATKAENLEAANRGAGCLGKAADDEPVFILRAQDRLAPALVRLWAELAKLHDAGDSKIIGADEVAREMEVWQLKNRTKFPD